MTLADVLKQVGEGASSYAQNWGCFAFDEEAWDMWETIPLGFDALEFCVENRSDVWWAFADVEGE